MTQVVQQLDAAFAYVCHSKLKTHHNHDIWDVRFNWVHRRLALGSKLLSGSYYLSPAKSVCIDGHSILVWNAIDTIVLKAISMTLEKYLYPMLGVYKHCYHTKGQLLRRR